ncbi:UNVERIFIED_CONTAM: hypothetical protein FKN15_011669 [Acipenser sinensis]
MDRKGLKYDDNENNAKLQTDLTQNHCSKCKRHTCTASLLTQAVNLYEFPYSHPPDLSTFRLNPSLGSVANYGVPFVPKLSGR